MRPLSGKEVCAILAKNGFVNVRQHGSHIIMLKKISESTITIPVPNHREIKIGTLQSWLSPQFSGQVLSLLCSRISKALLRHPSSWVSCGACGTCFPIIWEANREQQVFLFSFTCPSCFSLFCLRSEY